MHFKIHGMQGVEAYDHNNSFKNGSGSKVAWVHTYKIPCPVKTFKNVKYGRWLQLSTLNQYTHDLKQLVCGFATVFLQVCPGAKDLTVTMPDMPLVMGEVLFHMLSDLLYKHKTTFVAFQATVLARLSKGPLFTMLYRIYRKRPKTAIAIWQQRP